MCMSLPGRVVRVAGGMAEVERDGRRTWFNALMVPEAGAGDWVLTHTGLVVSVITQADAEATEKVLAAMRESAPHGT
jgi:hydrogenase expression/formation protein HypC